MAARRLAAAAVISRGSASPGPWIRLPYGSVQ